MATTGGRVRLEAVQADASVTPLELFFDLVFVFALTQVTAFLADNPTAQGVVRGLLLLGLMWWSWVGYAWLGNVVRADEGAARVAMLSAMGAMFVLALCIPEAFDDAAGGLPGPLVVALCYFAFRALHLALFWIVGAGDVGLRRQLLRFTPSVLSATALLVVAAATSGTAQTVLWGAALVADYVGTFLGGASGWRLRSAGHFAERHGLIVIVALGESIVAIGVGVAEVPVSWSIVAAAALGLAISAALWWLYFDVTALMAERALSGAAGEEQAALARDAYSFIHLPLVAGVVLVSLGLKKVLEYVGDTAHHDLADSLSGFGLFGLFGGVAVYLLGQVGFELRASGTLNTVRLGVAIGLAAVAPLMVGVPALVPLGVVATVSGGLVAVESRRLAEDRDRLHHEGAAR
ncbi:MAG: low temperature requirement protein A [Acidimicrobiia bacterium]|nr:low temperature requirement protein A [Acidimicrobiia bacterium]